MVSMKAWTHGLWSLLCAGMVGVVPAKVAAALPQGSGKAVNLALGAEAFSGSCYGAGYEAKYVTDGNWDTRWASAGLSGTVWLTLDLKGERTFNCIDVYETEGYKGRIEEIVISVSNDGIGWKRWLNRRPSDARTVLVGEEMTARYVQVSFWECSPEGINVDEIGIYDDPQAVATPEPTAWREDALGWIRQLPSREANVYQQRKAHLKYGMFIHYGMNTFLGQEWSDGSSPASAYHPDLSTLNPEAWVKVAYEGGMNFIVLVTKHHDGFALWNTEVGTYNINHTGRKGDRRDIVKEVADACRKYGIKLGLYYSAWDRNWDANHTQASTGYVAFPTRYLYGKKGVGFTVKAEDLSQDGYRFVGKEEVVEGRFGKTKRIEFVYEDVAGIPASGKSDGSLSGSYSCHMN